MKQIKLIGLVLILLIIPLSSALTFNKVTQINLEYDKPIIYNGNSSINMTYLNETFIPYTGALYDVDLGNNDLSVEGYMYFGQSAFNERLVFGFDYFGGEIGIIDDYNNNLMIGYLYLQDVYRIGNYASNKGITINRTSGNVGIKTTPSYPLHVQGDIYSSTDVCITGKCLSDLPNQTYVDNIMPIGSITAFAYSLSGVPSIPSNWKICDGTVIIGGPMNGTNSPNLISRFLYGGTTSGGVGGTSTHQHDYSGTTSGPSTTVLTSGVTSTQAGSDRHTHTYSGKTQSTSTMPPYYTVVWIMRIY